MLAFIKWALLNRCKFVHYGKNEIGWSSSRIYLEQINILKEMECYVEIPFKYYDIFYQHLWTILSREDESQHKLELFYLLSLPFNSAQEINNEFRGKMIIPQVFSVNKMHREFSSDNDWKGFRKRITFCFGYWLHGTIFYSNLLKGLFSKLEFIGYFIKSSRPENKYRIFYLKNIICFIFDWKVQTPCPITH